MAGASFFGIEQMAIEGDIISREEKFAEMLEGLLGADWPPTVAHEVADLAFHAVDKMCEALREIADRASLPVAKQQVFILASEMMFQKMDSVLDAADNNLQLHTLDQIRERMNENKSLSPNK